MAKKKLRLFNKINEKEEGIHALFKQPSETEAEGAANGNEAAVSVAEEGNSQLEQPSTAIADTADTAALATETSKQDEPDPVGE